MVLGPYELRFNFSASHPRNGQILLGSVHYVGPYDF